jgi:hypothetical protein
MEILSRPPDFAFRAKFQPTAHERALPLGSTAHLRETLDSLFQSFYEKAGQRNPTVNGDVLGLAEDFLGNGEGDILLLHVFTCST